MEDELIMWDRLMSTVIREKVNHSSHRPVSLISVLLKSFGVILSNAKINQLGVNQPAMVDYHGPLAQPFVLDKRD